MKFNLGDLVYDFAYERFSIVIYANVQSSMYERYILLDSMGLSKVRLNPDYLTNRFEKVQSVKKSG